MKQAQPCDGCAHRQSCSEVFERLGRTTGPNVAVTSTLAFVMPIVVFVGILGGVEALLADRFSRGGATAIGVVAGFVVAGCCVVVAAWWRKKRPNAVEDDTCHADRRGLETTDAGPGTDPPTG